MAEIINILPINPTNFEFQEYSIEDNTIINSFELDTVFDPSKDYIEYFIYDLNGNILIQNNSGYPGYKLIDNNVVLDPVSDVRSFGFDEGQYNTLYNFLTPELVSNNVNTYFISQISPDRTEIRLDTTSIPNELVVSSSLELTSKIDNSTGSYYDFYLNFGNNDLVIAVNALLDNSNTDNPTVLIKLYEPLPPQFNINTQTWVVSQISNPVAYNISIENIIEIPEDIINLSGPNFNLALQDQLNNSTAYINYAGLKSTTTSSGTSSFNYQLNNILAQTGISVNVDYSDYSNFIHFSSAQTRLENFYYKLQLLEEYNYSASLSTNPSSGSYYVSSSNIIYQNKINEIITGFDGYEYFLYYSSGSTSWPKTNSNPPYINYSPTSISGSNWFISQSLIAEQYDIENNNALTLAVPSYIREDLSNEKFELFVEMIGQLFDNIFVYLQDVTTKSDADNRLNYGVSKDLVADVLRDMGVNIYQNNFSSNDLYQALIGLTPSGSLYNLPFTTPTLPVPTGSFLEYITTYITASSTSSIIPTDDVNKSQYKRIYHNLPLLLKKKGSVAGIRDLITTFGVANTILRINEFGGKDQNPNSFDNWQNEYNYVYYSSGSNFVSSSFVLNSTWDATNNRPSSVEFRFKPNTLPYNTASIATQILWQTNNGVSLQLRYTGSGYTSGSYSGSIIDPYYQYALLEFIPSTSSLSTSASVYLPFYNENWWAVTVNSSSAGFELLSANKSYTGEEGNTIVFYASSSVIGSNNWSSGLTSIFGSNFSGSLQEIRYYTQPLSKNSFEAYVMNPYSTEQSENLAFRATLGGQLYKNLTSVHPKVTGSWIATSSFVSNSNFTTGSGGQFISNNEVFYFDQVPAGIQNAVSNKIKQQYTVLPYTGSNESNIPNQNILSPFISVQQQTFESSSYTKDTDYVELAFSPQNEINDDINSQIGYFNIGQVIGDPRFQSSLLDSYPELDAIRYAYFEKYDSNYDWNDYIRLIKFFDNSLFKLFDDFIPARTSLAAGIVIKQTLLERNRYRPPQVSPSTSIAWVASGSTNIPYVVEDLTITGSVDVGTIEGGNGGSMPDLFGQTQSFDYVVNITQSWTGITPSLLGNVPFTQTSQTEFYDGQLSGSNLVVTDGTLAIPSESVLINNALDNRENSKYLDVDFSEGQIIAVNQQQILSGSATKATVPDSYYTTARIINPRYEGSKYSGEYNYTTSFADRSTPIGYPIDNFSNYFIYFDWIGSSTPQYPGGGNIHGVYLISTEGEAIPLTGDNKNSFIVENTFVKNTPAYIYPSTTSSGAPTINVNIVEGGALYETILLSTGSENPVIISQMSGSMVLIGDTYSIYFNTSSLFTLTDSGSLSISGSSWIYALSNPSSSIGTIESFYFNNNKGVSIYNKKTGQYINSGSTPSIINYNDTFLPLRYGDMIRFGTTASYSISNRDSLDGTFTGGGLFQINNIITGSDDNVISSINITPLINTYPFVQNTALSNRNNQNIRIMRRIQYENFILVQNIPSNPNNSGFLVPFNFNPNYNIYDLAKKAGII